MDIQKSCFIYADKIPLRVDKNGILMLTNGKEWYIFSLINE